jgi:transposase InsO family protein
MILGLVDEAVCSGASQARACEELGVDERTLQRWRSREIGDDMRAGPSSTPGNKLSPEERAKVLQVACCVEFRDKSPKQIVPILADRGEYTASEATFYRVLREEDMMKHRGRAKAPTKRARPSLKVATGTCQLWSWDITYLPGPIRGTFFYLYVIVDVWSRKIVGRAVHLAESTEHAGVLIDGACVAEGIERGQLTLHSDNGSPMKGATMLATLQRLGVSASFSRPSVSDDNPYSEALFRTAKYCSMYPSKPFESVEAARAWVDRFVAWYNEEHLHSGIRFVTPSDRHAGRHLDILERRREVYEAARARHPERWGGGIRCLDPIANVILHPLPGSEEVVDAA